MERTGETPEITKTLRILNFSLVKEIQIPALLSGGKSTDLFTVSKQLSESDISEELLDVSWKNFSNRPDVRFKIAYGEHELYIQYKVKENYLLAENTQPNEPVYEDSCVEFFIRPEPGGPYFNFEFNCIGTCLVQKGTSREDRSFLKLNEIEKIRVLPSLGKQVIPLRKGNFNWELTAAIPYNLFMEASPGPGREIRMNFYKCGDHLPQIHYLVWNPVQTPEPDFHQPVFFGKGKFI